MEARLEVSNQLKGCFIKFLFLLLKLKPVSDISKQQKKKSKPSLLKNKNSIILRRQAFLLQRKVRQIFQGQSLYR